MAATDASGDYVPVQDRFTFFEFCQVLDTLDRTRGKGRKEILSQLFAKWRALGSGDAKIDSSFAIIRLLLPQLDRKRSRYNLKQAKLLKLYGTALQLGQDSRAELENYKEGPNPGEAAKRVQEVVKGRTRWDARRPLSIRDVNDLLDELARAGRKALLTARSKGDSQESPKSKKPSTGELQKNVIVKLTQRARPEEHRWFAAIVLGDLNTGAKENSVWSAFHSQAADFYGTNTDIEQLCLSLHNPARQDIWGIKAGLPCCPMLSEKIVKNHKRAVSVESIIGGPFWLETKWDGERIHLHKMQSDCKYYSRNSNDFTPSYCTDDPHRSHWHNIQSAFDKVDTCILDGEMVGFNNERQAFVTKDDNLDVKALGRGGTKTVETFGDYLQLFLVWDIIFLNGRSLHDEPLEKRRQLLELHIKNVPGRLLVVPIEKGETSDQFVAFANKMLLSGHEGVILKRPEGKYTFGRRDGGWWKWKPEYMDELSDTIDLIVIGGCLGDGRRRSGDVSHFLLGIADPAPEPGKQPTSFKSFAKVGSGYGVKELQKICRMLKTKWKRVDRAAHPPCGMGPQIELAMPGFKEMPDFWIPPEESIIVEVKAATIIKSDRFAAGMTLRFPRLKEFRMDKSWYECASVNDLRRLGEQKQMVSGKVTRDMFGSGTADKNPTAKRSKPQATIHEDFAMIDVSSVNVVSTAFDGKRFFIGQIQPRVDTNSGKTLSRSTIAKMIKALGGQQEAVAKRDRVDYVISDVRMAVLLAFSGKDIIKSQWIIDCHHRKQLLPIKPTLLIQTSTDTEQAMRHTFDEFGDSYVTEITDMEFESMRKAHFASNSPQLLLPNDQIADFEDNFLTECRMFRPFVMYFDAYKVIGDSSSKKSFSPLFFARIEAKANGALIIDAPCSNCTHVVLDDADKRRQRQLSNMFSASASKPVKLISFKWIIDCCRHQKLLSDRSYLLQSYFQ